MAIKSVGWETVGLGLIPIRGNWLHRLLHRLNNMYPWPSSYCYHMLTRQLFWLSAQNDNLVLWTSLKLSAQDKIIAQIRLKECHRFDKILQCVAWSEMKDSRKLRCLNASMTNFRLYDCMKWLYGMSSISHVLMYFLHQEVVKSNTTEAPHYSPRQQE